MIAGNNRTGGTIRRSYFHGFLRPFKRTVSGLVCYWTLRVAPGASLLRWPIGDGGFGGVDGSEGMVAEARKKLATKKARVTFLHKDLRTFRLPVRVHLATSMFDSLNHLLTVSDLQAAFRRVFAALHPGGHFVFDVNNELCYTTLWGHTEGGPSRRFCLDPRERVQSAKAAG